MTGQSPERGEGDLEAPIVVAVWQLARLLRVDAERGALAGTGLHLPDYVVLHLIRVQSGVRVMDVGRQTAIAKATLSDILAKLRRKELIRGCRSDGDRRTIALSCMPAGVALVDQVDAVLRASDLEYLRRHDELRALCGGVERSLTELARDDRS